MTRVLIVDDEKSIRLTLKAFLEAAQYEVDSAASVPEALSLIDRSSYDVVLTDILMPQVSGMTLMHRVAQLSPSTQVIVMTGEPNVNSASEAVRAGALDYLFKPISKETVLQSVNHAARVKTLNDEKARLEEANQRYQDNLEKLVEQRTQALRESEERYRQLIEHSPDGILIVDADREVYFANRKAGALFGTAPSAITGRNLDAFTTDESAEALREQLRQLQGQETVPQPRTDIGFKDNDEKALAVETILLPFTLGKKNGAQIILRDLTQEKQLERQLQESQRMEAVGKLAGGVAHDFNNLLMVMLNNAQFARGALPANSPALADIDGILDATKRAAGLIRQLLAFSRRQRLVPRRVDLNEALKNVEKMLGRLIGEDIELRICPSDEPRVVKVDLGQFEQVIFNLAVNARDAMPKGGTLELAVDRTVLAPQDMYHFPEATPTDAGTYARVDVSDTGCGMDSTTQARVFEPFFTTKGAAQGTGLGLSTVYGIVRQHDGHILVQSAVGAGTTFSLYFPEVEESAENLAAEQSPAAQDVLPRGTATILLVEDEEAVRRTAVRMLETLGYEVLTASNAKEALAIAQARGKDIDLLFSDVVMPQVSGPELAQQLRQTCPRMKVLYASGYPDEVLRRHDLELNSVHLMRKPYGRADLAEKLAELLQ